MIVYLIKLLICNTKRVLKFFPLRVSKIVFCLDRNGLPASAICAFDKEDIDAVFDQGQFKTQKTDMSFWTAATDVPTPRPGVVSNVL